MYVVVVVVVLVVGRSSCGAMVVGCGNATVECGGVGGVFTVEGCSLQLLPRKLPTTQTLQHRYLNFIFGRI